MVSIIHDKVLLIDFSYFSTAHPALSLYAAKHRLVSIIVNFYMEKMLIKNVVCGGVDGPLAVNCFEVED